MKDTQKPPDKADFAHCWFNIVSIQHKAGDDDKDKKKTNKQKKEMTTKKTDRSMDRQIDGQTGRWTDR